MWRCTHRRSQETRLQWEPHPLPRRRRSGIGGRSAVGRGTLDALGFQSTTPSATGSVCLNRPAECGAWYRRLEFPIPVHHLPRGIARESCEVLAPWTQLACEPHRQPRRLISPRREVAPRVGLEPTTTRLTAGCSTIELSGIARSRTQKGSPARATVKRPERAGARGPRA